MNAVYSEGISKQTKDSEVGMEVEIIEEEEVTVASVLESVLSLEEIEEEHLESIIDFIIDTCETEDSESILELYMQLSGYKNMQYTKVPACMTMAAMKAGTTELEDLYLYSNSLEDNVAELANVDDTDLEGNSIVVLIGGVSEPSYPVVSLGKLAQFLLNCGFTYRADTLEEIVEKDICILHTADAFISLSLS